ncbi:hypothetical protein E2C01_099433 [Portunus trituberculatus]|uniref:Uncharacterized protein n=1 Tax=Portunus trituberculatus TaxID=210409 RepID=A0A5B7KFE0_PORTR|nr:hypothetical protein [Portunus trituberculatus]
MPRQTLMDLTPTLTPPKCFITHTRSRSRSPPRLPARERTDGPQTLTLDSHRWKRIPV